MKKGILQSVWIAFATALYFTLTLPTICYIPNAAMFDYGWVSLIGECLIAFVPVFILLVLVFRFVDRYLRGWLCVILTAILVCAYLETGFLSMGLDSVNGGIIAFCDPWRKLFDTIVLGAVFVVVLLVHKYVLRYAGIIMAVFTLMTLVMAGDELLAAMGGKNKDSATKDPSLCPQIDVLNSVEYSPGKNVLVFVLDSFPAKTGKTIAERDPALMERFPGFTAFDNNLGQHSYTARGFSALMVGELLTGLVMKYTYAEATYGTNSFFTAYKDSGYNIYFQPGSMISGYTNRRKSYLADVADEGSETDKPCAFRSSKYVPYISLYQGCLFKIVPYAQKRKVIASLRKNLKNRNRAVATKDEKVVFEKLADAAIATNAAPMIALFHTVGVHEPIGRDRNGEFAADLPQTPASVADLAHYDLERLADLFDALRANGVYDRSFIVVTCDHGSVLLRDDSGNHGAESALLWVKPVGANGAFEHCDLPTSHINIARMMRKEAAEDISIEEVKKLLYAKERHFVATKEKAHWWTMAKYLDWTYDENGNIVSIERMPW